MIKYASKKKKTGLGSNNTLSEIKQKQKAELLSTLQTLAHSLLAWKMPYWFQQHSSKCAPSRRKIFQWKTVGVRALESGNLAFKYLVCR